MVDSSEKVNVEKLTELQLDTIDRIIKVFPNVEFSPTIHELLWHSGQCIGKCQLLIRTTREVENKFDVSSPPPIQQFGLGF